MPSPVPNHILEDEVLPLLGGYFSSLTSLNLVWRDPESSCSALDMISRIKALEQLHLSAGEQLDWKLNWLIDHELMQSYLPSLPLIKKLAFSQDSLTMGAYIVFVLMSQPVSYRSSSRETRLDSITKS